jgi:hypothetical protein
VLPTPFRKQSVLRTANVAAVGLALAAVTTAVLGNFFRGGQLAAICGATTLVIGVLWASLLRSPRTVGKRQLRLGFALSPLFAAANAGVACAIGVGHVSGFPLGVLVGAIVWVPALVATLVCFGLPIARAQALAKKGLGGEERGEAIVGAVCVAMSLVAPILARNRLGWSNESDLTELWATLSFSGLGLVTGAAATAIALLRAARRRRFVVAAEAGQVPGFRVDPTDEGKVLVRVISQAEGYRVSDLEEELLEIDAQGEAQRPRRRAGRSAG